MIYLPSKPIIDWRQYWRTFPTGTTKREASLRAAHERYWESSNRAEQKAAYYEILLKGGRDGYPDVGEFRQWISRKLRVLAMMVDRFE